MDVDLQFQANTIEQIPLRQLKPSPKNARRHPKDQIKRLADVMAKWGFTAPVLIDDDNVILAGHGRLEAAKLLQLAEVPCIRIGSMTAAEKQAFAIADNALALKSGWETEILTGNLKELLDLGFDMKLTGFDQAELDQFLVDSAEASPKPEKADADEAPDLPEAAKVVSRLGDIWVLKRHRVGCGDAKESAFVASVVGDVKVDAAFLDGPYNVRINGHVRGRGKVRHREFVEASGEKSRAEFTEFLRSSHEVASAMCRPGAIIFSCMDWRHILELITAGEAAGLEMKNLCVWAKKNGGQGSFYRSQHELVTVWKVPGPTQTNTFGLGEGGRSRTNVWSYAGVNSFKTERDEELAMHATVKPVAMVMDAIRDVTNRGDIVLDTFGGSGTTLIAAEKVGRAARLVDLDPGYCDVMVRRWEKFTGATAVLEATGEAFEEVAVRRAAEAAEPVVRSGWGFTQRVEH